MAVPTKKEIDERLRKVKHDDETMVNFKASSKLYEVFKESLAKDGVNVKTFFTVVMEIYLEKNKKDRE